MVCTTLNPSSGEPRSLRNRRVFFGAAGQAKKHECQQSAYEGHHAEMSSIRHTDLSGGAIPVANAHLLGAVVRMEVATSIGWHRVYRNRCSPQADFQGPYGQGDILWVLDIDEEELTVRRKASPCKLSARSAFLWKIIRFRARS